jgi:hypothetical protein
MKNYIIILILISSISVHAQKVFTVQYANQADQKIFFTIYANRADMKIYFVKYRNQTGWNNNAKKHLF